MTLGFFRSLIELPCNWEVVEDCNGEVVIRTGLKVHDGKLITTDCENPEKPFWDQVGEQLRSRMGIK